MLLPIQVWEDIPGYEGLYQVSNTGKVRSLGNNKSRKTKILKQNTTKNGYKRVGLWKNGKRKPYYVHRLVAQVFLPNPNNLPEVNHIDENKQNNVVWNLEWCDREYNLNYGTRIERFSKNNPNAKAVLMFDLNGDFIQRFDCINDAVRFLGKNKGAGHISACAKGKPGHESCYGYKWQYEEEQEKQVI